MAPVHWGRQSTFTYSSTGTVLFHNYFSPSGEQPEQHAPLWKSNQNEIWSTLSDINALCLICIKRSIEEVKTRQISKGSFQQGPRNETLKKAQCQISDVMFGHWIIQAVALFDYRMCGFTRITFNSRNNWSKGVVLWFSDFFMILHKWYFHQSYTTKYVKIIGKNSVCVTSIRSSKDISLNIYSGTVGKRHDIVVTSLIWHMTPLGLYHCPDSYDVSCPWVSEPVLCRLHASQTLPQF